MLRRILFATMLIGYGPTVAAQQTDGIKHLNTIVQQAEKWLLQGKHQSAFELLKPNQTALFSHPDGAYIYGVLLLRLGKPEAAYTYLSTVVSMSPNNAGAKLDLALAAMQIGRYYEAQNLLDELITLNNIPPGVLALVNSYKRQVEKKLQLQVKSKRQLEFARGYDSNVNMGLVNAQVVLNTLSGARTLQVAEENRAMSDAYTDTIMSQHLVWANTTNKGQVSWPSRELLLQARLKEYEELPQYQQKSIYIGGGISLPQWHPGSRLYASLLWQDQQQQVTTASVQWMQKFALPELPNTWLLNLGHSRKRTRHSDSGHLSVDELELSTQGMGQLMSWQLSARAARQQALNTTTINQENRTLTLGAGFTLPVIDGVTPQFKVQWNKVLDNHAYNITLFGDKAKLTELVSLKFNLKYDLDNRTQLFSHIKWDNQSSNINLFDTKQWQMGVGIRAVF